MIFSDTHHDNNVFVSFFLPQFFCSGTQRITVLAFSITTSDMTVQSFYLTRDKTSQCNLRPEFRSSHVQNGKKRQESSNPPCNKRKGVSSPPVDASLAQRGTRNARGIVKPTGRE